MTDFEISSDSGLASWVLGVEAPAIESTDITESIKKNVDLIERH